MSRLERKMTNAEREKTRGIRELTPRICPKSSKRRSTLELKTLWICIWIFIKIANLPEIFILPDPVFKENWFYKARIQKKIKFCFLGLPVYPRGPGVWDVIISTFYFSTKFSYFKRRQQISLEKLGSIHEAKYIMKFKKCKCDFRNILILFCKVLIAQNSQA